MGASRASGNVTRGSSEMSATSIVPTARSGETGKIVTAREAVRLIRTGDTIAVGGFGGIGIAEEVVHELGEIYKASDQESASFGKPADLTLFFGVGQGNPFTGRGLNRLGEPGLIKRVIGGHFNFITAIQRLVVGNEYLFYKAIPINVGINRGTTADPDGNITMEREALTCEALSLAMAAHNSGGLVIAQVERIAEPRTLNPRQVKIPGAIVDCIVVATKPESHMQTYATVYSPAYSSEVRVPMTSIESMEMSERKIIERRDAMELRPNSVVNLGVGMPEGIASVAAEEKIADLMTLTAEPGVIGGIPAGGLNFGAATNAQAVIDMAYQFDFYDGGGLDAAFLGLAQADKEGNLNVSKFGSRLAGAGGFINISQSAKKVVFCGTLTAGDLEVSVVEGKLLIERDGKDKKFVNEVEHRTFSGTYAAEHGKDVIYVT